MLKLDNGIAVSIASHTDGHTIEKVQHIPQAFLDSLKTERFESMNVRETDYQRVASIPVCLVDRWLKEGYDVFQEPIRKTVAKLKSEHLEYFVTTGKNV